MPVKSRVGGLTEKKMLVPQRELATLVWCGSPAGWRTGEEGAVFSKLMVRGGAA